MSKDRCAPVQSAELKHFVSNTNIAAQSNGVVLCLPQGHGVCDGHTLAGLGCAAGVHVSHDAGRACGPQRHDFGCIGASLAELSEHILEIGIR